MNEPPLRAPCPTRSLVAAFALVTSLAQAAPARVPTAGPAVDVKPMGAHAQLATETMRAHMRDEVTRRLRALSERRVLTSPLGYVVDGSIDGLEIVSRADGLEISCSVRLILSARRSGAMLVMTTGQATLHDVHRTPKPATLARLEQDALDGAVRAASDELVEHLEARRKS